MTTGEITKTGTLAMTLHKPVSEANPYVRVRYRPLKNQTHPKTSFTINEI